MPLNTFANQTTALPLSQLDANFTGLADLSLTQFIASGTGAVTRTVLAKERDIVSVKDYGATGDGVTDDTAAIQAAITAASTNGGDVLFPAAIYKHNTALTLAANVRLVGYGATLLWGGSTTAQITSASTGVLVRAGMVGLKLDSLTSSQPLQLRSPYECTFKDILIKGNSSTSFAVDISVNTSGATNQDGNRNAVYCYFENILQEGTCGTGIRMNGDVTGPAPVTLCTFHHVNFQGCAVRGMDAAKWVDNVQFTGISRFVITANNGVGAELNTDAPTSNNGVYAVNFENLAIDTFAGGQTGRIALKLNWCKQIKIGFLFNEPLAEGGFTSISANAQSYDIGCIVPGTNNITRKTDTTTGRLTANGGQVPFILAKSSVAVSCPADTSEDTLATIPIPAGAIGANGAVRTTLNWSYTNSANLKTFRTRYSGAAGTIICTKQENSALTTQQVILTSNRNATNSQYSSSFTMNPGGCVQVAPVTTAVDTTAATTLVVTGQKATAGETLTLDSYLVELISDGT